jgi:aminodeoxyfutalosine deaminase
MPSTSLQYIAADYLFYENDFQQNKVLVVDGFGKVISIENDIDEIKVQRYKGILCPAFINTHCHLELSHLRNKLPCHTGLAGFVKNLVAQRFEISLAERMDAVAKADNEMWHNGIAAVGDISNEDVTLPIKKNSPIHYHTFVEMSGVKPENATMVFENGMAKLHKFKQENETSLAAHAPYSVSNYLFGLIKNEVEKTAAISTIHNQETQAESDYFKTKTGALLELYDWMKVDYSAFTATQKNSLASVINLLPSKNNLLFVHNTFSNETDFELIKQHNANSFLCTCPNANLYIENRLPNYKLWLKSKLPITVGTDSLASNTQLSVFDEMKTIAINNANIGLITLLQWATVNGAAFLNCSHTLGSFNKGKHPGVVLLQNATPLDWLQAAVLRII